MQPNSASALERRLSEIERLLGPDPARAEALARRLLAEAPGHPAALLLEGIARRLTGNSTGAVEALRPLCERLQDAAVPHLQFGLALRESGDIEGAESAIRRAIAIQPDFSDAWLALVHLLPATDSNAGEAFAGYIAHAMQDRTIREAAAAVHEKRLSDAEPLLRRRLERYPRDVLALWLLAKIAASTDRPDSAEALLKRCLDLAPDYSIARHDYAMVLVQQKRPREALREIERLLADEPANFAIRKSKAATLHHLLDYAAAAGAYEELLRELPDEPGLWASLGHCLRILGRQQESIDAYRRVVALAPHSGEAYWNLANLKTYRITDAELEAMLAALEKTTLEHEDRTHLHFAVGKALEDRESFEESFRHYSEGNRLRRQVAPWDGPGISDYVTRCMRFFTPAFFAERAGYGADAADPIFIIGLPRSGSTLVEQILASHPAVEGTAELSQILLTARALAGPEGGGAPYPKRLASLSRTRSRELGEKYIERTRAYRKSNTPLFIDKTPNNFEHLGLMHLILPRARIIDVRREPMACGLSLFRHLFARGESFSYGLEDIGRYYREYLRLMEHFDATLPGRVHRVDYEALVQDTETEVRRLLDHCGLSFEASCLQFHENTRAVSTPSSEQVRSPIFRQGLDRWRHFEPWLGPLKRALAEPPVLRNPAGFA